MPAKCEGCSWEAHYRSHVDDVKSALASFPPRHSDAGLCYDRQEVEEWLAKVQAVLSKKVY